VKLRPATDADILEGADVIFCNRVSKTGVPLVHYWRATPVHDGFVERSGHKYVDCYIKYKEERDGKLLTFPLREETLFMETE
jgi:hypothetical protein